MQGQASTRVARRGQVTGGQARPGQAWQGKAKRGQAMQGNSRQGQESVLKQALELTPASKILWSTDGHFYPETFYLANRQFREALEAVLPQLVLARDLDVQQAINVATDILFWNSISTHSEKKVQIYNKERSDPFCRLKVPLYLKILL